MTAARKRSKHVGSSFEIGYVVGAVLGAGYVLWKERGSSQEEIKQEFKVRLSELVDELPEMLDRWVGKRVEK